MEKILIKPSVLRSNAQTFRQKARTIQYSIEDVEKIINALSSQFTGFRANSVKTRYNKARSQLLEAASLVSHFASDLEVTANTFEKADNLVFVNNNSLFVKGENDDTTIHPSDIDQEGAADCYLLAPLANMAQQDPDLIRKIIRDNGDGTYTVTFYEKQSILGLIDVGYKPVEIIVSPSFPMSNGSPTFAGFGDTRNSGNEVWGMVIEKAYAEWKGGYPNIDWGSAERAIEELTGMNARSIDPDAISIKDFEKNFDGGHIVVASTLNDFQSQGLELYENDTLATRHAYSVSGVNVDEGTISLRNPWGWENPEITIPYSKFQESFSRVITNG